MGNNPGHEKDEATLRKQFSKAMMEEPDVHFW
jgi:hypothetical protein